SSIRLPRMTTTRVSSGWEASISILLGIISFPPGSRQPQLARQSLLLRAWDVGAGYLNVRRPPLERHGGAARSHNGAV
ncbi:hypothetical protein, partial [Mesorhizobium sp. M7A.T.Ca.TU.009.02.1.1]|uniref:hypothetical protein n=1 Tax=Mesorhizobium sp. M7A.T.Ca.TU.009.02.1.1 TaxID=2496791 RepID=UPI0019D09262